EALVGHHDVAPGAIERTVVGMRTLLLRPVRAWLAFHRRQVGTRAERAVLVDWKQREAAGRVVREREKAVGAINRQVNTIGAAGRLPIQNSQTASRLVDLVSRDLCAIAVRRVQMTTGAVEDEKRRIGDVLQLLNQRPRLCLGVALIDAQP